MRRKPIQCVLGRTTTPFLNFLPYAYYAVKKIKKSKKSKKSKKPKKSKKSKAKEVKKVKNKMRLQIKITALPELYLLIILKNICLLTSLFLSKRYKKKTYRVELQI